MIEDFDLCEDDEPQPDAIVVLDATEPVQQAIQQRSLETPIENNSPLQEDVVLFLTQTMGYDKEYVLTMMDTHRSLNVEDLVTRILKN